ncbi:MAG: family 16 glycoside hydrolase, partial [Fibrobacterota bacterium]
ILSFFTLIHATIVLNETFDTDTGWLTLSSATDSVYDGKMHMASTNANGLGWLVNNNISLKKFTISVETQMIGPDTNAKLGISFMTQDNTDAYQFYVYPSGHYFIAKYTNSAYTDFSNGKLQANTFISGSANTLKIVGLNNTFSFLCNGQLLTTITDNAIPDSGKFGLIITGQLAATFDNLLIDNEAAPDNGLKVFQDDFSDSTRPGWNNNARLGSFTYQNGKLRCASYNSGVFSTLVSDGNYGIADTISVITEKVLPLPSTTNLYGLFFHYSTVSIRDTLRTCGYIFCILNGSYYSLLRLSDARAKIPPTRSSTPPNPSAYKARPSARSRSSILRTAKKTCMSTMSNWPL